MMGKLKVYADRMSQPSRAVLIFCRFNGIDFEEIKVDLSKRHHLSPEFTEVNPLQKVPAIHHGNLNLFESHAFLVYLSSAFPGVADHWRAKINSVLDWHHSNLRYGAGKLAEYDEPMNLMKREESLFKKLVEEYWSHFQSAELH